MLQAVDIDPQPITDWLLLFLAITGVITAVISLYARAARARSRVAKAQREEMIQLIKDTTLPLQSFANGGLSLPDLHAKMDRLERRYEDNTEREHAAREIWHDKYLDDQRRIRKEWTAVFIAIRKMIHLPPADQIKVWDGITQAYIDGTIAEKTFDERKIDDEQV